MLLAGDVGATTGIVRGSTRRQRAAAPGSTAGDAQPFTAVFTLTFVDVDGEWKPVALHTSRAAGS